VLMPAMGTIPAGAGPTGTSAAAAPRKEEDVDRTVHAARLSAIHAHDIALANRLRNGLGLPLGNSAIVSADIPHAKERLARAGLRASERAGRVRLSCHIYTTEQDIE